MREPSTGSRIFRKVCSRVFPDQARKIKLADRKKFRHRANQKVRQGVHPFLSERLVG